jgi:hypothetical protein
MPQKSLVVPKFCECCLPDSCPRCLGVGDALFVYTDCGYSCSPAPFGGIIMQGSGEGNNWLAAFMFGSQAISCNYSPTDGPQFYYASVDSSLGYYGPFNGQMAYSVVCGNGTGTDSDPFELRFHQSPNWNVCTGQQTPPGTPSDCIAIAVDYHPLADCLQDHFGTSDQTFTLDISAVWPGPHVAYYVPSMDWWRVDFPPPGTRSDVFYFEHGFMWHTRVDRTTGEPVGAVTVCTYLDCEQARWYSGIWGGAFDYGVLS